ncbi:hypothetical protein BP6252_02200 [Coleophoma cylindrospora]|uniref:Uncharacterized protein n=1 Tax=Coleophoma cylindrospora TaxID=1849047 RepID=A0A3D8SE51_9HELO|nr:hypothetical protein BP6252_02200 [Coleophoma cylindrospora]
MSPTTPDEYDEYDEVDQVDQVTMNSRDRTDPLHNSRSGRKRNVDVMHEDSEDEVEISTPPAKPRATKSFKPVIPRKQSQRQSQRQSQQQPRQASIQVTTSQTTGRRNTEPNKATAKSTPKPQSKPASKPVSRNASQSQSQSSQSQSSQSQRRTKSALNIPSVALTGSQSRRTHTPQMDDDDGLGTQLVSDDNDGEALDDGDNDGDDPFEQPAVPPSPVKGIAARPSQHAHMSQGTSSYGSRAQTQPVKPSTVTTIQRLPSNAVVIRSGDDGELLPSQRGQPVRVENIAGEQESMLLLETLNRQHFLVGLHRDDKRMSKIVKTVYPGMSTNHAVFQSSLRKTRRDFKNWKLRLMDNCTAFVNDLVAENAMEDEIDFQVLQASIGDMFQEHWAQQLYSMSNGTVNFDAISVLGWCFLKYAACQLLVHGRLSYVFETTDDPAVRRKLEKYTRLHFLAYYEGIHDTVVEDPDDGTKFCFNDLSVEDFPMLEVPIRRAKNNKRARVSLDNDSDGAVGKNFFASIRAKAN